MCVAHSSGACQVFLTARRKAIRSNLHPHAGAPWQHDFSAFDRSGDAWMRVCRSAWVVSFSRTGVAAQFIMKMDGCAPRLAKRTVALPEDFARCLPFERCHCYPRRADTQPEKPLVRDSAWQADGDQRRVGLGQELAGLRHHLCRGAAQVCGVAFGVRAAVSGADREAGRGRDRRDGAGHRHQAEEHDAQSAVDGGDGDGDLRLPAAAVRALRRGALRLLRRAGETQFGRRGGRGDSGAGRGYAAECAVSGDERGACGGDRREDGEGLGARGESCGKGQTGGEGDRVSAH